MLRDFKLLIADMMAACERATEIVAPLQRRHFDEWSVERLAVERLLLILGEAAKGVPQEVRDLAPDIPWRAIMGVRDRLVHAYADTDQDVIWTAVVVHVPNTRAQLQRLMTILEDQSP